ncbi:MAG: hypothetical protein QP807_07850 [Staphylococcus epidermidis]|uniref:hypothetical protein n=1 Tax=Staphylococcus TaxID=1279 RepID=UPI00066EAF90|nr:MULTISPECIES: hypothetical protein [Staphylococcus]KAB2210127.1 hypothetical protein F9B19_11190 [Staphylococcus epidermidis]MBM0828055.1 hypothetical protein [Staphylococcus epidermidis]MBM5990503.1 hypothetical protein [Staphylococcus epidermidis]MBM6116984.1 hypothetical protein [Staphylococcus epidermidis]MCG1540869.1 hypothetical protein [Staphylococcus epidermidis]
MINIINEINSLKFKDKVTIMISIGALILSLLSYFTSRKAMKKNNTCLKLKQTELIHTFFELDFENKLVRNSLQNTKLWKSPMALYYLCITIELKNLSHSSVSLGNFMINKIEIPSSWIINKTNVSNFNGNSGAEIQIFWTLKNRDYDKKVNTEIIKGPVDVDRYNLIYPELRLESKSTYTGIIIISLEESFYNKIKEGKNKLTIKTPDKNFHKRITIDKTPSKFDY